MNFGSQNYQGLQPARQYNHCAGKDGGRQTGCTQQRNNLFDRTVFGAWCTLWLFNAAFNAENQGGNPR